MFVDEESGVDSYLVTVGSRPGHGDVMQGQKVTADCQEFHTDVSMTNGHSYYVTVGVSDDEAIDEEGGGLGWVAGGGGWLFMTMMLVVIEHVNKALLSVSVHRQCRKS